MADKSFGVKELNLLNASGTPTVTSPNNLNLNANTVAISTSCTIGNNLTVTSTTNSANLNVTGIGTLTRAFATDLSVSGVTTITVPANANPHSSWDVVNNSASAYRFTGPGQDGAEDNPNIYLVRGQRYVFKMNASGHPFQIRVANAGAAYSDGVTNNGSQTGNVVFNVQHDAPAQLFYQCTSHGSMVGNIYIVGGPQVISGIVTATTFVGNLTGNVTGTASGNAVLTGSTNDQLVTVTGANAITGESGLTYNGTTLSVTGNLNQSGSGNIVHYLNTGNNSGDNSTIAFGDSADADAGYINYDHGTNALQIRTNGGSNSLVIGSDGNFGVGTNSPNYKTVIQVSDTTAYSASTISANQFQLAISNSGANGVAGILLATEPSSGNGGHCGIRALSTGNGSSDLTFSTRGSSTSGERLRITSAGQVAIRNGGTTSQSANLIVFGDADNSDVAIFSGGDWSRGLKISTAASGNNDAQVILDAQNANNGCFSFKTHADERLSISSTGRVEIKSDNGNDALTITPTASASTSLILKTWPDNTNGRHWAIRNRYNQHGRLEFMRGTSNSGTPLTTTMSLEGANVTVVGSLSKGSGSFKIDHPLSSKTNTHHLVHSFIEGPQADLIYRGKVDLVGGTSTVNIDTVAGMSDGTFVLLNREVQCFTSNETGWTAVKGSVSGNVLTITAQDNSCTDTISWMVVGERKDPHMYGTEWTDVDGKVIVEPLKETDTPL